MTLEGRRTVSKSILSRVVAFPFLPILVALVIPLTLVKVNPDLFTAEGSLTRDVIIAVAFVVVLTLALAAIYRDLDRAGMSASVLIIILIMGTGLARQEARALEAQFGIAVAPSLILLAMFLLPAIVIAVVRIPRGITYAGNMVAAGLLSYNAVALWLSGPNSAEPHRPQSEIFAGVQSSESKPDIIHILLDGYSRQDVLSEVYGYDNSQFLSGLKQLGFEIAENAVTPYNQTLLTMESVFYGNYLPVISDDRKFLASHYRTLVAASFRSNPVFSSLQEMDYQVVATKSEFPPLSLQGTSMAAETNDFSMTFLERTVFEYSALSLIAEDLGLSVSLSNNSALAIQGALRTVIHTEREEKPHFYFVHLLAPHPPFDIDSEGTAVATVGVLNKLADGSHFHGKVIQKMEEYRSGYLAKLRFANSQILPFVEKIIANHRRPLVIILHGDHGGGVHFDQDNPDNTCLRERFAPLVAIYSSDNRLQDSVPANLNLINLYRIIFNTYFGTKYEKLPSKSAFVPMNDPTKRISIKPERLELECRALPSKKTGDE